LAVDALGIDLEKDVEAVAGPLGHLGSRDAGIEPKGHARVSELIRDGRQRARLLSVC
jgi:hypothetical protein